jgi:hemolysin activation/secretion protein
MALAVGMVFAPVSGVEPSTPAASAGYRIDSFVVSGSTALPSERVEAILREATGPDVALPRIRAALGRLQQAYRDAGFVRAAVRLPRQSIAGGIARVEVVEDVVSGTAPSLPAWTVPTFDVRSFVVQGNTVLQPEEIDAALGDASGPTVDPARLREALRRLREAYVARGHSNAVVRAPRQWLVGGAVSLAVEEGPLLRKTVETNTAPVRVPLFEVRRYDVRGNTLLPDAEVARVLAPATGTNIGFAQIRKVLGDLQLAYRERGWATASVSLPQQRLTNATVRVDVVEGLLTEIHVAGNRHVTSNNVMRALPSLRTNAPLNSHVFQRELDIANRDRDRQIFPVLGPGPEPGTSALTLRVKDRLPIHSRVEVNNQVSPGTPEWRLNLSAQHRNLWQREHQMGLSYGFSPEAFKSPTPDPDFLLNRPQVSNLGGYYRIPFGEVASVSDRIRSDRAYGFDEGTRQFRLPPVGGRSELSFFAGAASIDTGVKYTAERLVSQTPLLTIRSRDSGRNVIAVESGGARISRPFNPSEGRQFVLSAGVDAKHFSLDSFNTNNFIITTVVTNAQGSQTIRSDVASPQPTRSHEVLWLPLVASADAAFTDPGGSTTAGVTLMGNFLGNETDFDSIAYSRKARTAFGKANLQIRREQRIVGEWSAQARVAGQVATGPLLPVESFALGGLTSVRGYYEGDETGDAGWVSGLDLLTPQWRRTVPTLGEPVPAWLRASVFFDAGQRFKMDSAAADVVLRTLWSVGFGLSANVNNAMDLKITVGWPLADSPNREALTPRANLSLGGQF